MESLSPLALLAIVHADLVILGIAVFLLCRRADHATPAWTQILSSYQSVVTSLTDSSQRAMEIDAAMKQGQSQLMTALCGVVSRDYLQKGLEFATVNNPTLVSAQPASSGSIPAPTFMQQGTPVVGPEDITGMALPVPPLVPDPRQYIPANEI